MYLLIFHVFFADFPEDTPGGQIFSLFRRHRFFEIWISEAQLSTNHYYQEKDYQWHFHFLEYGDLWRIEDTFHEGNRSGSNLKNDIPRGVILSRAYEYFCQKYILYFLHIQYIYICRRKESVPFGASLLLWVKFFINMTKLDGDVFKVSYCKLMVSKILFPFGL